MKLAWILALLALVGCASPPAVIKEPVEVRVPVPVYCKVKPVPVPPWATEFVPMQCAGMADEQACQVRRLRAMGEEIMQRIEYEIKLQAAVAACIATPELSKERESTWHPSRKAPSLARANGGSTSAGASGFSGRPSDRLKLARFESSSADASGAALAAQAREAHTTK